MSKRRSQSSRRGVRKSKSVDRDHVFPLTIQRRATKAASNYQIVIQAHPEGGFAGRVGEMRSIVGFGETVLDCYQETLENLTFALAILMEDGQKIPSPFSDRSRAEQVNVRLTSEEKQQLVERAKAGGFRGVSDYVRAKALAD